MKRNPKIIKRNYEIWKDIKGFPGYQISCFGRVRSLTRFVFEKRYGSPCEYRGRVLQSGNGPYYPYVRLSINGIGNGIRVHNLVIEHFGKPKPSPKHECNHKDGDKSNNWNTNLEWMTHKQNMDHAIKTGLNNHKGENHSCAKLTEKEVKNIRKLSITGKCNSMELSKIFKVSQAHICNIIKYRIWKYTK